jgi:hypothetical protein
MILYYKFLIGLMKNKVNDMEELNIAQGLDQFFNASSSAGGEIKREAIENFYAHVLEKSNQDINDQ